LRHVAESHQIFQQFSCHNVKNITALSREKEEDHPACIPYDWTQPKDRITLHMIQTNDFMFKEKLYKQSAFATSFPEKG
jgi:hypothetical protein